MGVSADNLAVFINVFDKGCTAAAGNGNTDLYLANPDWLSTDRFAPGPVVIQIVFRNKKPESGGQVTIHQYNQPQRDADFPYEITASEPYGYRIKALIPLSLIRENGNLKGFLLEQAALYSAGPGASPSFNRLFAEKGDRGAFRDAGQSALVTIGNGQ